MRPGPAAGARGAAAPPARRAGRRVVSSSGIHPRPAGVQQEQRRGGQAPVGEARAGQARLEQQQRGVGDEGREPRQQQHRRDDCHRDPAGPGCGDPGRSSPPRARAGPARPGRRAGRTPSSPRAAVPRPTAARVSPEPGDSHPDGVCDEQQRSAATAPPRPRWRTGRLPPLRPPAAAVRRSPRPRRASGTEGRTRRRAR